MLIGAFILMLNDSKVEKENRSYLHIFRGEKRFKDEFNGLTVNIYGRRPGLGTE